MIDCPAPYVVDGDGLRCGRERLRLLGIDAPEIGACPANRRCAPGNGVASRQSLSAALRMGPVRYSIVKRDRYGRAVVMAWAGSVNLSCWQLQRGHAVYRVTWDTGGLVNKACR